MIIMFLNSTCVKKSVRRTYVMANYTQQERHIALKTIFIINI